MEGGGGCGPYFDPEYDSLVAERIPPPRVCIDNETCEECTLVKVDSANRHGILLEMVQVLTDLDLLISKSYISSDGGWLMDVFHVTDQLGNKLTDHALIRYIQQSLVPGRRGREEETSAAGEVTTCLGKLVRPCHLASEYTALEVTATDQPGLLSEISAVLVDLDCFVVSAQAWTHKSRAAVIIYVVDHSTALPISDPARLSHVRDQVETVVGAHLGDGERRRVRVSCPSPGRVHTERRLHQLMHEDRDYETLPPPPPAVGVLEGYDDAADVMMEARWRGSGGSLERTRMETRVWIDSWKEKGYAVVNIRSRDRPKLLFDTVCTLTDMQYNVFHAAVSSHGPIALQEYYIRHMDGCTLDSESKRQVVSRCLVAAVERRVSHGLRVEVCTKNRKALLLRDVTRALRESGLSLTRAECTNRGERAVGTFYVTDASGGGEVDPRRLEVARKEVGESMVLEVRSNSSLGWAPPSKQISSSSSSSSFFYSSDSDGGRRINSSSNSSSKLEDRPRFSLGSLLWSHIGRLSSNFGSIRS